MLQAAIFDIDGTLMDSVDAHAKAWSEAFASKGYEVSEQQARSQIGKGGDTLLPTFLDEAACSRDGNALEEAHGSIFHDKYFETLKPFADVKALFEALHARKVRIALASSSEKPDLEHYLDVMGVRDLVEVTACGDDVKNTKPAPDIFGVAIERLTGLDPAKALAFGDSPWDALSATKAGLRMVGMRCGGFADADLREAGASEITDGPSALLADLDRLLAMA